MSLAEEHCIPCRTGDGKLTSDEIMSFLPTIPSWQATEGESRLELKLKFPDFLTAQEFVNKVGALAEAEGHHPDISFGWGYVHLILYTHKAQGLTRNDFVLASKIDVLAN